MVLEGKSEVLGHLRPTSIHCMTHTSQKAVLFFEEGLIFKTANIVIEQRRIFIAGGKYAKI